jgi:polyisoprenoid-binding protein YceI
MASILIKSRVRHSLIAAIMAAGVLPAVARVRPIDTKESTLTIHVGKTGFLSAAAHEHTVIAPILEGAINDGSQPSISFEVRAAQLQVQPEEHRDEVQQRMQQQVLGSNYYPTIRFVSTSVESSGQQTWRVAGTLTLHGQSRPVHTTVRLSGDRYVGTTAIRQTDFGIQPVGAAGGAVKVKDQLRIDFSIRISDSDTAAR